VIHISVNCFHDAATRDPKLLHFKYYYPVIDRLHSQIRSHSLAQSHMKDNDMRKLMCFDFSIIIHFHHCYITISNTVKQAYKDGIAKLEMWCRTEEDQNHISRNFQVDTSDNLVHIIIFVIKWSTRLHHWTEDSTILITIVLYVRSQIVSHFFFNCNV
jgi:hypothetical protein